METEITKIAVGVMIFKDNKILFIRRQGSHGAGEYALPGGKMEYGESFDECIRREIMEETGILIKNISFINVFNSMFYAPKHFIILGFKADWESGEARIMEPNKCDYIGWHDINDLPEPLFKHSETILKSYKTGENYHDLEK